MASNNTAFIIAASVALLLFIPATRVLLLNPFNNPMLWVVLAVGLLLLYFIASDTAKFKMSTTTRSLMVLAFIAVVIFVIQPGLFKLERESLIEIGGLEQPTAPGVDYAARQAELTGEALQRITGNEETLFDEIVLKRNLRLEKGMLSVTSKERIEDCDEAGVCTYTAGTRDIPFEVDAGAFGKDFESSKSSTFNIKDDINTWMDYCAVEECHAPIQVKTIGPAVVTLSLDYETIQIEYTPAQILIEREGVPALQIIGTGLFLIAVMITLAFIMRKFAPKRWAKIARILAKVGVR